MSVPTGLSFAAAAAFFFGTAAINAEEHSPVLETIRIAEYPVQAANDAGLPVALVGEDRLQQVDARIIEIPAGGKTPPHRHLAEEIIYVIAGRGHTDMWVPTRDRKARYDWQAGDLLSPSLNTWHQHVNSSDTAARYLSITSGPITRNVFPEGGFATSSNFVFEDRWQQGVNQQAEYTPEGGFESSEVVRMRVGHYLPDIVGRELRQRRQGAWGITILPEGDLAGNHVLEMEVREKDGETFTDAQAHLHRHPWEVVYVVLAGEGYSDLRKDGEALRRVHWRAGDLFIVEANEYHDNRAAPNTRTRYLQVKAAGYFRGIGNVGGIVVEETAD